MKKTIRKFAASILASAIALTTPIIASAEDNDRLISDNQYVKTETIYFDDLVLTLDETTASSIDSNLSVAGDTCYTTIPAPYWGAYNSADGNYYLQINSGNRISFRGLNETGRTIFCHYDYLTAVSFTPSASSNNFTATYSRYTVLSDENSVVIGTINIIGTYKSTSRQFIINKISYYYQ